MAKHKRNGANLKQEGPTRAGPAEWNQSTQDDIGAYRCAEPTGSAPSRPPIRASPSEATVTGHGFTSGMRFANPFVFILQFCLIPAVPRQQRRHWMAEHKRNGANLEQEGPTRAGPAE
ncbi:hypothetical protein MRX96_037912 [Rhipicephalus microplus]